MSSRRADVRGATSGSLSRLSYTPEIQQRSHCAKSSGPKMDNRVLASEGTSTSSSSKAHLTIRSCKRPRFKSERGLSCEKKLELVKCEIVVVELWPREKAPWGLSSYDYNLRKNKARTGYQVHSLFFRPRCAYHRLSRRSQRGHKVIAVASAVHQVRGAAQPGYFMAIHYFAHGHWRISKCCVSHRRPELVGFIEEKLGQFVNAFFAKSLN